MGKVVVLTNLKGGVGKTTDTSMTAMVASQIFHKKVLLIDVDIQANSTQNMTRTFGEIEYPQSFTKAVQNKSLRGAIKHLSPYLDFIAGTKGTHELVDYILEHSKTKKDRYLFFKKLIDEIKDEYDYIFFDVAPSTDNTVDAIVMITDYIVAVQEVKRFSMDGTDTFINEYLFPILQAFPEDAHFQVIGVLPAIFQPRRKQQQKNYEETISKYGRENVFKTLIKKHDRLEGFGETGIELSDYSDRKIWALFADFFSELEERIDFYEQTGDTVGFEYKIKYFDSSSNKTLEEGKKIKITGIEKN